MNHFKLRTSIVQHNVQFTFILVYFPHNHHTKDAGGTSGGRGSVSQIRI